MQMRLSARELLSKMSSSFLQEISELQLRKRMCAILCADEIISWPSTTSSWLELIIFQPFFRQGLASAMHLIFWLGFLTVFVRSINKPRMVLQGQKVVKTRIFFLTQSLTIIIGLLHMGITIWRIWLEYQSHWSQIPARRILFSLTQAMAWTTAFFVLAFEERYHLAVHLPILRGWWIGSFVACLFDVLSYMVIWITGGTQSQVTNVDLLMTAVTFPVTMAFLVASCGRGSGVSLFEESGSLVKPLINESRSNHYATQKEVTAYRKAGYLSKALFLWVNSLLETGSKNTIQVEDIPLLMVEDRAESLYSSFELNWGQQQDGKHSVAWSLVKSRWSQISFTGCLYLLKLSVMYVGPLMIQRFIEFTTKPDSDWVEGVQLVLILFCAKLVEELTERQRNFLTWKLYLSVKSSLIATVFRKSLRLSNSARQSHGTGQLVNYVSVDVEEISNFVINFHNLWVMPLQIILALVILFGVMGLSTVAGLGTMVALMGICLLVSSRQRRFWKQIMGCKDCRIKVTNEAISNIKIIKMQAWQDWSLRKVEEARENEQFWAARFMYVAAVSVFLLWLSPLAVSVATFGTCVLLRGELNAGSVFTAIATFRILQDPLRAFPSVIMSGLQAATSLTRLKKFFESDEIDYSAIDRMPHGENFALMVKKASFKWDRQAEKPILHEINLQIRPGSLVTVVGTVGSGKSSLLSSILGEMEKISGKIAVSGRLAYVAQSSWIQNGTIQENILFGKPMYLTLYTETLRVCSLQYDLAQFVHRDQTIIGERGFNLSGGQKQRIQLARAVYQDADIYLLDDIFSAVDAHTGTSLFMDCIKGVLATKTVILVTHQIEFLHGADLILVMRDGQIVQSGNFEELLEHGVHFADLVDAHNLALQTINMEGDNGSSPNPGPDEASIKSLAIERSDSKTSERQPSQTDRSNLMEEEERAKGRVDKTVYWAYLTQAFKGFHVILLLLIQSGWQGLQISSDFWLAYSTSERNKPFFQPKTFMSVYSLLAIGSGLFVLMRSMLISFSGLLTAQTLYVSMLRSVFHAPMSFFDATPTGRILTRSSTDQVLVDFTLPFLYGSSLANGFQLIGVFIVTSRITWQLVLVILPLALIYFRYQSYFIATSRELTRLKSITDAPIIHHFKETIAGFMTIRAFGHQERFAGVNAQRIDTNIRISFHNGAANNWLSFRLETIGIVILCSSALFLVLLPKSFVNPEFVGLSLSYGLALSGCLNYMIFYICQIEQNMVAVERILQFSSIDSEQPPFTKDNHPSDSWPENGNVAVRSLQLRYRPGSPLVLKDLSFVVRASEKLGVVGRTGSGKSSFIQALFRLVEPAHGTILIDGVDIRTICLNDLRSRISIIPQEPTLFEGTVRNNIDPLGVYQDHEIWNALEKCQLADSVRQKEKKLDAQVAENGENWSMGQRQLFCLGRVLLKRSRILVLDEATASIDTQTDWILQRIIREEFLTCTVISIAHRIPSVMGSDKVLVLDNGEMKEFGAPAALLDRRASLFAALVHEYSSRSKSAHNLSEMN